MLNVISIELKFAEMQRFNAEVPEGIEASFWPT